MNLINIYICICICVCVYEKSIRCRCLHRPGSNNSREKLTKRKTLYSRISARVNSSTNEKFHGSFVRRTQIKILLILTFSTVRPLTRLFVARCQIGRYIYLYVCGPYPLSCLVEFDVQTYGLRVGSVYFTLQEYILARCMYSVLQTYLFFLIV